MPELHGPILVSSDLSAAADSAIRFAAALAESLGTAWRVCHVVPEAFRVRVLFPQDAGVEADTQREIRGRATEALRRQVHSVVGHAAADATLHLETGTPHTGVLQAAASSGAGLIVMTPGATATRVARAAGVPVLIHRDGATDGLVLGATDFSDPSLPALRMAVSEARRLNAPLRLVHCLDVDASAYLAASGAPGLMAAMPIPESAVTALEVDARAKLEQAAGDVTAEIVVLRQSPSAGILHEAARTPTRMIIVGSHGRSGLARLALGSVAERVMHDAACSVLVVPLHPH